MASPAYSGGGGSRLTSPPAKGSDASTHRAFFEHYFDYQSTYRAQLAREWSLAKSFVESMQWVRLADSRVDPRRAFRWTQQNPSEDIPKPVQNEILGLFDNEVAKLGRRQSKPYVRPLSTSTESRGGASAANDILNDHLDRVIKWPRLRRKGIFQEVLYGLGVWKSYWDLDYRKTVKVGAAGAVKCSSPDCSFVLRSTQVKDSEASQIPMGAPVTKQYGIEQSEGGSSTGVVNHRAEACFNCGSPLEPAQLLPEEALSQQDSLGRPLFDEHPMGDAAVECVSPFDFFPGNEGIDQDPETCEEFGQETPRDLDWVANHYDVEVREDGYYYRGERILPEDPVHIAQRHPILGESGYWSGGPRSALDRNLYRNHILVREYYRLPSRRFPEGIARVMAGRHLLMDDDLMIPSRINPGALVPRAKFCISRFWPRDGELFAMGLCVPLFSPQMRINMTYSQVVANRETSGTDALLLTKGMRLLSPGWNKNYAGRTAVVELDPEHPQMLPQPIQARVMDVRVFQEVDRTIEHMRDVVGAKEVDRGGVPANVGAATAIQLLQEKAAERRDSREQELKDCFRDLYSHVLLLLSEKVVEPRNYRAPGKGKTWEVRQFIGSQLKGFTDAIVDEESAYDVRSFEREGLVQAVQLGLLKPDTPFALRETMKAMGLPMTITDETNVQVDDAERKWFLFRDEGRIPVIDPFEDSHFIHWQVYGKFLKGEDGIEMKERAGWEDILPHIANWEMMLDAAVMMDQQVRASQAMAQSTGMQIALPQQDPYLMMLPPALEDQVFVTWMRMLEAKGQQFQEHQVPFVRFKAVTEAHRRYGEGKKAGAMMGAPSLAAPGGGMTPAGTEPAPGGQPPPQGSTLGPASGMGQAPQPQPGAAAV